MIEYQIEMIQLNRVNNQFHSTSHKKSRYSGSSILRHCKSQESNRPTLAVRRRMTCEYSLVFNPDSYRQDTIRRTEWQDRQAWIFQFSLAEIATWWPSTSENWPGRRQIQGAFQWTLDHHCLRLRFPTPFHFQNPVVRETNLLENKVCLLAGVGVDV